jgi:hypothetical protein
VLRFLGLEHDKGSVEALMSSEGYSLYCREEESADGAIHDRLQLLDHGASLRPTVESRKIVVDQEVLKHTGGTKTLECGRFSDMEPSLVALS